MSNQTPPLTAGMVLSLSPFTTRLPGEINPSRTPNLLFAAEGLYSMALVELARQRDIIRRTTEPRFFEFRCASWSGVCHFILSNSDVQIIENVKKVVGLVRSSKLVSCTETQPLLGKTNPKSY